MKLPCIHCGKSFDGVNTKFCSQFCKDSHIITIEKKTVTQMLKEEKEKLLAEIDEKVKKKNFFMNSGKPETGFRNISKKNN